MIARLPNYFLPHSAFFLIHQYGVKLIGPGAEIAQLKSSTILLSFFGNVENHKKLPQKEEEIHKGCIV
jgi:hypothetical protein